MCSTDRCLQHPWLTTVRVVHFLGAEWQQEAYCTGSMPDNTKVMMTNNKRCCAGYFSKTPLMSCGKAACTTVQATVGAATEHQMSSWAVLCFCHVDWLHELQEGKQQTKHVSMRAGMFSAVDGKSYTADDKLHLRQHITAVSCAHNLLHAVSG